jgi:periplasmic divalent cation tolerance protein
MKALLVTTTTDTKDEAAQIASQLLDAHLVACVQIVPGVESHYWWKGEKDVASEWLCLIKTTEDNYEAVEAKIKKVHTYDEPEIIAVPLVLGSASYLDWFENETKPREPSAE